MYAVIFIDHDNNGHLSLYFETKRAARKWKKWLSTRKFVKSVRVLAGGIGGTEIK